MSRPLNGCMCQDGRCEALRELQAWCDSNINGAPPAYAAAMEKADAALALADEVSRIIPICRACRRIADKKHYYKVRAAALAKVKA